MQEDKKCKCPLCEQQFTPEDGLTAEEHLAKGITQMYREMQNVEHTHELPCPRCGHTRMKPELEANAVSRHFDVYICSGCGSDEAMHAADGKELPLTAWSAVYDILKSLRGIKCKDYIPQKGSFYTLCDNPGCEKSETCNISVNMADSCGY